MKLAFATSSRRYSLLRSKGFCETSDQEPPGNARSRCVVSRVRAFELRKQPLPSATEVDGYSPPPLFSWRSTSSHSQIAIMIAFKIRAKSNEAIVNNTRLTAVKCLPPKGPSSQPFDVQANSHWIGKPISPRRLQRKSDICIGTKVISFTEDSSSSKMCIFLVG